MDWLTAERASVCFGRALLTADGCRGSQLNDGDILSIVVCLSRACCCGMGFSEVAKSQPRSKYVVSLHAL
jgi:hypothetical protein